MSRMIALQEEERRGVARELHDEVGALLTAVRSRVGTLEQELREGNGEAARELAAEAGRLAGESLDRLRGLLESLRAPMLLEDLGLVAAIESDVERRCEAEGLDFDVRAGDELSPLLSQLRPEAASACFRVVQEALTNVIRHAEATRVDVTFERQEEWLLVTVEDDGHGFELNTDGDGARDQASLGVLGMHERAQAVGGELSIESRPGEGTAVRLSVPLAPDD